jgi:lipid A biosynthesis lauroyl/palmitoleoyl acyltransferase
MPDKQAAVIPIAVTEGMSQTDPQAHPARDYRPPFEWRFLRPVYWPTWLLVAVLRVMVVLPLPVTHAIGRWLGRLYYHNNEKRRRIAHINVRLCFPEMSSDEQEKLVWQHFEAYGANVFDFAMVWWASLKRIRRLTRFHGLDTYLELIESGCNVVLVTGHLVTVDLSAHIMSQFRPGVTMMKPLKNPLLNWLISRGRHRHGNLLYERSQGLRPLVRHVRRGRPCYFLPDEDFGAQAAVFAPYFGIQSWTVTSLATLARLGNATVVPVFTHSLPSGQGYEVYIGPVMENFPTGDSVADATAMNRVLEEGVRKMPEMYAWTFKLFKTRPQGEENPYQ